MSTQTKYFRCKKIIRTPDGDKAFDSINKAKAESRRIQNANGGLGRGVLRVVAKLPKHQDEVNIVFEGPTYGQDDFDRRVQESELLYAGVDLAAKHEDIA